MAALASALGADATQLRHLGFTPRPRKRSRFRGVFRCGRKFKAQIQTLGVQHYLGLFDCEEDAARAYDRHARLVLGHKAKTNFPPEFPLDAPLPLLATDVPPAPLGAGRRPPRVAQEPLRRGYVGTRNRRQALAEMLATVHTPSAATAAIAEPGAEAADAGDAADDDVDWREQIYYWTGDVVYEATQARLVWRGRWLGSFCGRPDATEFATAAPQWFAYASQAPTATRDALAAGAAADLRFAGVYALPDAVAAEDDDRVQRYADRELQLRFCSAGSGAAAVEVVGRGDSDFGVFLLYGRWWPQFARLDVNRRYLRDDDPRAALTLDQLCALFQSPVARAELKMCD